MSLLALTKAKSPWHRCQVMLCDCTDRVTHEKLPDHICHLIHERDWHRQFQTARARRAEELLEVEIEFLVGDNPRIQTPDELVETQNEIQNCWADEVPVDEDYRVASPSSLPLRAVGALR